MDMLKKIFPFAFNVKEKDVNTLVVSIIIHVVIMVVCAILMAILNLIPIVNILTGIIGWVVEIYCVAGIVLAVLNFLNVLK